MDEARIHQHEHYYVIQRAHLSAEGERSWVDSSGQYWGEVGRDAALPKRDEMREIFGEHRVRAVRRDVHVIETTVES